jgi:hypothetical protein
MGTLWQFFLKGLGVSICLDRVLIETLDLDKKKADRDSRENLNTFKILVWTILTL